MLKWIRRWTDEWRPGNVTMGAPIYPLLILFGLNAVDELDRSAFGVLLPDIRDHFGMTNAAALTMVSITTTIVLLLEIPLSFYVDRANRVKIAMVGAAIWAIFSFGTGLAWSISAMYFMRVGAGGGKAVVNPTHNSLLSDYYEPAARLKVFSFHRQANSLGFILGPLIGGVLGQAFGWRAPFFVFAFPTLIFVFLALKMKEPERGFYERQAAEAAGELWVVEQPAKVWESMRILYRVRTIRRIWLAMPFLGIALVGISQLLALIYEDVYDLEAGARGAIAAGVEPLQIFAVFFAMPRLTKIVMKDPAFLIRFVAVVGVFDGFMLVAIAYAPGLPFAILAHMFLSASIGTLVPAFFALLSIVAPPRVRAVTFTTITVFAIPGVAIFLPLIGRLADTIGIRQSMLVMVPITLTAGFVLSTASRFIMDDISKAFQPVPAEADA